MLERFLVLTELQVFFSALLMKQWDPLRQESSSVEKETSLLATFLFFVLTNHCAQSSLVELLRKTTWPDAVGLQSVALSTAGSALFVAKGLSQSERIKLLQCFSTPFDRLAQEFGTIELGFLKEELHSDLLTLRSLLVVDDIPTVLFTNPEKMFAPRLREIVCAARRALQDANEALSHCLTLTSGIRTTELLDILCKVLGEVRRIPPFF